LEKSLGKGRVAAIFRGMDEAQLDENSDRFVSSSEYAVLICDRVGEEGRNLQIVDHAVFLDLPFHPFRIEQRCGRFDRIGQTHAVTTIVFLGPEDAQDVRGAWFDVLRYGFQVFSDSISALQLYAENSALRLATIMYLDGAPGLRSEIANTKAELHRERQRAREQDVLDSVEERSAAESDWIPELLAAEGNSKAYGAAIHPWVKDRLHFSATPDFGATGIGMPWDISSTGRPFGTPMSSVSAEPPKARRSIAAIRCCATPNLRATRLAASNSHPWRWPYENDSA
jgi:ATP-dependent helicase HepA